MPLIFHRLYLPDSAELFQDPFVRFFLRASSCNDVMEACRLSWLEAQKKFTRAEKRDRDFTKRAFKLTFIGVASAVLMNADPGDDEVTIFSRDEVTSYMSHCPPIFSLIPFFIYHRQSANAFSSKPISRVIPEVLSILSAKRASTPSAIVSPAVALLSPNLTFVPFDVRDIAVDLVPS